jgi:hypothetical protein
MQAILHDGTVLEFPDETSTEVVQATVRKVLAGKVQAPSAQNDSLGAQAGLFARSTLRAGAGAASIFTEPLRYASDRAYEGMTGKPSTSRPLTSVADQLSDFLGLPQPATPMERKVDKAVEFGMGAGGLAKAAQKGGEYIRRGVSSLMAPQAAPQSQQVLSKLGERPVTQAAAGAGGGYAGQQAVESGGDPVSQVASAVLGSLGTAGAIGGVRSAVGSASRLMPRPGELRNVDRRIELVLQQQGIDPATITPAMRSMLREQVRQALRIGDDLNPDAVGRLADYSRLGLTPTRGRVTLDPYDVTQEQNAAKLAAATGSRTARLPQIAQDNNRGLVGALDDMGGAAPPDPYGRGVSAMSAIRAHDDGLRQGVDQMYAAARQSAGRPIPLDGAQWTRNANAALDRDMVGSVLPPDISRVMNQVATGELQLTVEVAEQIKTALARISRSSNDGNVRHAVSIVRRELDNAPVFNPSSNPSGLPAVAGTVPPSSQGIGDDAVNAFNRARGAARGRFAWQESSPVIGRGLDDGTPADTFIANHIISKSAGFDQVRRAAQAINDDPTARESVRTAIVQHLKTAALGRGGNSATGNFSGKAFTAALDDIGTRKLGLFFEPDEIARLRAMARVGSAETFQPRGSAVNNSNSAAAIGSLVQGLAERVSPIASKLPFGSAALGDPLDSLSVWLAQRPSQQIPIGLLASPPQRAAAANHLAMPLGLLALPRE